VCPIILCVLLFCSASLLSDPSGFMGLWFEAGKKPSAMSHYDLSLR
jgi:hypothetical protein